MVQRSGGEMPSKPTFASDSAVFVVRIWREVREDPDAVAAGVMGQCRGRLEHVATGSRHYFATYDELLRHIQRYAGCVMNDADAPQLSPSPVPSSLRTLLRRAFGRRKRDARE